MNKEYTYIDGKVIISDENGKQTPVEYYDNIDDVLVQENLVETMEDRIVDLEKESKSYKNYNRKHYIPLILPASVLMTTIGVPIMLYYLTGINTFTTSVDTIFGIVNQGVLLSSIVSFSILPISVLMEFTMYRKHKNSLREEKGVNSELEFLRKQLVKEKQALENLKKEKKRDYEDKEFRVVEVDDKQQLQTLKSYLSLYFDLGYNGEKYSRYLQQGKLDAKLRKYYNDTGIEVAKEYLEEKGPTLVKRKKQNN